MPEERTGLHVRWVRAATVQAHMGPRERAAAAGKPETNFRDRPHSFKVMAPARTVVAYARVPEVPAERKEIQAPKP